jgi:hypothetical protein
MKDDAFAYCLLLKERIDRGAVHDCAALPLSDAWENPGRDVGR